MQVLELIFAKEDGKTVVFSIDTPITPIDAQVVNQVMDTILSFPHLYFHPLMKIQEKKELAL